MKRGGMGRETSRRAAFSALICVLVFSLALSCRVADLNRSLRAQVDRLNDLLAQRQAEILGLKERLAADDDASAEPASPGETAAVRGAPGAWEPAPPRLWTEYRDYQELYPALRAERSEMRFIRERTVYLTFDDGPTIYTERVLDTLKEKGVKATFFVVGNSASRLGEEGAALLRRMADEGHTIGIHCNVHDYKRVYASVEAFLDDFNAAFTLLHDITGLRADIFRFPGGSVNGHNAAIREALIAEMERRGFTYYDWNASSNDTSGKTTEDSAWRNAVSRAGSADRVILLLHDTKESTVRALPRIIDTYRDKGYAFARLTNADKPIVLQRAARAGKE
ncbi:MAG: polysaccharide deacetylase [Clostridiales Family XIII bacterium]|jgi:peptidoglycan/xylan/chitin deacetylase (PgdA/CDA1 family)|nr:polysaccharide deacetylase [Clostridiales Family XIII bacterium]